jgi:hypothetical protein
MNLFDDQACCTNTTGKIISKKVAQLQKRLYNRGHAGNSAGIKLNWSAI